MEHILEDLISKDLSQNFQNMFHGVLGNLWRRIRGLDFDLDLIEIFLEKKLKKKTSPIMQLCYSSNSNILVITMH